MQPQTLVAALFATAVVASSGPPARSGPGNGRRSIVSGSLLPRAWMSSLGLSAPVADVTKRDTDPLSEVSKREPAPATTTDTE
ncbi:hypothetical protein CPLU01_07264 [Colletotrichum plurivorum]|uniref:Secreted protein n=1 Tax=Colletotrichum plurivorum TaxID=2175906 RepID=A0A8H6KFE6_9PEZI|nr:hypothetical protein CPLU01_07264 [Colletotrichum plurivorum]